MAGMNLDTAIYPYAGPCMLCGHRDKRHRIFDAVRAQVRAGDPIPEVADNYDLTIEAVTWIVSLDRFPRTRRKEAHP